ncbi:hypothetical protein BN946_scf184950.g9 [Trametes cinnabarina]|uniref:Uncharacterized protein n=1 Tax=Pycnoporus cinnabarinus TaxID=5643 RepID=A0A060SVR3_PYCCI|nr:hypothetical protein BN946_scf184950.g9 [Trametes cinnabarina]
MPVNVTVSHASPLLNYIPRNAWFTVSGPLDEPELFVFSNTSFHATNGTSRANASVAFSWWGTVSHAGVWLYGIPLTDSGQYNVVLDGTSQDLRGFPGEFRGLGNPDLLFSASDLFPGEHEVRVVNTGTVEGASILTIDHLVFESDLETDTTIEHNSTLCEWEPKTDNAWQVDEDSHLPSGKNVDEFHSLTYLDRPREGSGIAIYGYLQESSASFSVTIDGHIDTPYIPNAGYGVGQGIADVDQAVNQSERTLGLLYANMNLFSGAHTLLLENNPISDSATLLSVSYGVVYSEQGTTNPEPPPDDGSGASPE